MVALLPLVLAGCIGGPQRPDPTEVVTEYLTAIASGDASTATALDTAAVQAQYRGSTAEELGDFESLRTDAVLEGAEDLISDVAVEPRAVAVDGDDDVRRVRFAYELDGQETESSLQVHWDESESAWVLGESLTLSMSIEAVQSKISLEAAPFRLGGVEETFAADTETAPLFYLVYPGVYRITADISREFLARDAETVQTVVAEMPGDVLVQFDVSELPSR